MYRPQLDKICNNPRKKFYLKAFKMEKIHKNLQGAENKVGLVSLGCPKALVDSERILTRLKAEGYIISPSYEDADAVIVNTCGFLDSARQESLNSIQEAITKNGKVS